VRRRPRQGKRILVCPKCQSPQIAQIGGSILGQVYHCQACDYVGSLVLEIDVGPDGTPLA
jgi:hypothetical protein